MHENPNKTAKKATNKMRKNEENKTKAEQKEPWRTYGFGIPSTISKGQMGQGESQRKCENGKKGAYIVISYCEYELFLSVLKFLNLFLFCLFISPLHLRF